MNLTREIIENLFLQIIDTIDGKAILEADMYKRIGTPIPELSGVVFARNKESDYDYLLKYNDEDQKLYFERIFTGVKDEQSTNTDTVEETTTD